MILLRKLHLAERHPDQVVALRDGERLTWERFRAEVGGAARELDGCRRAALLCQDGWRFAVGLFGLLSVGATVVLPANVRPATLAVLAGQVDRVVDDAFTPGGGEWLRAPQAETPSLHFHTSGSTGQPKRIERGLGEMEAEIAALRAVWGQSLDGAVTVATVPHQHVYGLIFALLWPLAAGRPFISRPYDLWEDLLAEMPDGAVLVTSPAHLTRLGGLAPLAPERRPRLILSAGAPLPEAAADEARQVLGMAVSEIYGSTESGAIATRRREGGQGAWTPLPGYRVSQDEAGLMRLEAPFGRVDLADRIEPAAGGGFHLRGRADRVAKIEGKRIGLDAVEQALAALPEIAASAVLVLDDPEGGAVLAAVVELSLEGRISLAARGTFRLGRVLRRELSASLEPAGLPRRWRFVASLPDAPLGKRRAGDLAALFGEPGDD